MSGVEFQKWFRGLHVCQYEEGWQHTSHRVYVVKDAPLSPVSTLSAVLLKVPRRQLQQKMTTKNTKKVGKTAGKTTMKSDDNKSTKQLQRRVVHISLSPQDTRLPCARPGMDERPMCRMEVRCVRRGGRRCQGSGRLVAAAETPVYSTRGDLSLQIDLDAESGGWAGGSEDVWAGSEGGGEGQGNGVGGGVGGGVRGGGGGFKVEGRGGDDDSGCGGSCGGSGGGSGDCGGSYDGSGDHDEFLITVDAVINPEDEQYEIQYVGDDEELQRLSGMYRRLLTATANNCPVFEQASTMARPGILIRSREDGKWLIGFNRSMPGGGVDGRLIVIESTPFTVPSGGLRRSAVRLLPGTTLGNVIIFSVAKYFTLGNEKLHTEA